MDAHRGVAGRLNRDHADLVDIAVELIEGGHWGDGGFRSPEHYFVVRAVSRHAFTDPGAASLPCPDPGADATPGTHGIGAVDRPTYADALAEIAYRALSSVTSTSRSSHSRVYLHLSTDGAWVNGGGAIPPRLLGRFLTDGVVQPVGETGARPVSVGRAGAPATTTTHRRTRQMGRHRDPTRRGDAVEAGAPPRQPRGRRRGRRG